MHFFTEPSKLMTQTAVDAFGPVDQFESIKFRVNSKHLIGNDDARIYAVQSGLMIALPYNGDISSTKINLILKPTEPLQIGHTAVKYYVYRGLKKDSLLTTDGLQLAANTPETRTEFIRNFWKNWSVYLAEAMLPPTNQPSPKNIGFDNSISNTMYLDELFNSPFSADTDLNQLQAIKVAEGEWLALAEKNTTIVFEIVTDTDHFEFEKGITADADDFKSDLKYAQADDFIIDLTNFNDSTLAEKLIKKGRKEKILNFMDPVAFFGMHASIGVKTTTYSPTPTDSLAGKTSPAPKKYKVLFTDILAKFANPNRVYLDVRSEKSYSYNFYENYAVNETIKKLIKSSRKTATSATAVTEELIGAFDWPLIWLSNFSGTTDNVKYNKFTINFRIDDNLKPLLFVEDKLLLGEKNKDHFVTEKVLRKSAAADWSDGITFQIPNYNSSPTNASNGQKLDIAYWVKLIYLRQVANPPLTTDPPEAPSRKLIQLNHVLDKAFGAVPMPDLNILNAFGHYTFTRRNLIQDVKFAYIGDCGVYQDSSNVVLYADNTFSQTKSNQEFSQINLKSSEIKNLINSPTFRKNMVFNKWQATHSVDGTVQIIELLGYTKSAKYTTPVEDILMLGLTKTELATISGSGTFSKQHRKLLVFKADPSPRKDSVTNLPYLKFDIWVQGLDADGKRQEVSTGISVFGTSISMLSSKNFASSTSITSFFPDPGNYIEYDAFHTFKYDKTHPFVTGHPSASLNTGIIEVEDGFKIPNTKIAINKFKVELKGEVFFPVDKAGNTTISTRESSYPLIVIVHGNGHQFDWYDRGAKLPTYLALNGFIVVSISLLTIKGKITFFKLQTAVSGYTHLGTHDGEVYYYQNATPFKLGQPDPVTPTTINEMALKKGTNFTVTELDSPPYQPDTLSLSFIDNLVADGQGTSVLARSNTFFAHLKLIKHFFDTNVANNIGIYGHSRGGEAVLQIADDIATKGPTGLKSLNAIVSLNPTDQYERKDLIKNIPYFVLLGSRDGDVSGIVNLRNVFIGSNEITGTGGFSLFDRATNTSTKSLLFVHRATHNGFLGFSGANFDYPYTGVTLQSPVDQAMINRAYSLAFFRSKLRGEHFWDAYLQGKLSPASVTITEKYPSYRDMGNKLTVSNFNSLSTVDFNTLITAGSGITASHTEFNKTYNGTSYNNTDRKDPYSPHYYKGLYILYTKSGGTWDINVPTAAKDASTYAYLSFRIGQVAGKYTDVTAGTIELFPAYNDLSKLKVTITDGTHSAFQQTLIRIPDPDQRLNQTSTSGGKEKKDSTDYTKSAMMTIRLPLSLFAGVTLSNITKITFEIPAVTNDGALVLDDIDFTI